MLKVFLGGEGKNDIGTRHHVPMGELRGVAEVLLRRVRPEGWRRVKLPGGSKSRQPDAAWNMVIWAAQKPVNMMFSRATGSGSARRLPQRFSTAQ